MTYGPKNRLVAHDDVLPSLLQFPKMAVSLVRNLLIYPDQVNEVLEASQITDGTTGQCPPPAPLRRVLAVISHKDDWNPTEEGW